MIKWQLYYKKQHMPSNKNHYEPYNA